MPRVRLIHWNGDEARQRAVKLEGAGYEVDCELLAGPEGLRELKEDPPDALIIDLSQGEVRRIALAAELVDYKVCSIDATWTGLRFSRCKAV